MKTKEQLRKKFLNLRKKNYFQISNNKFKDLIKYLRGKYKINRKLFIALYYPSNFEIDILKIIDNLQKSKITLLLPKIEDENLLKFIKWKERDVLEANKYGIPEPLKTKKNYLPDIVLVPLLAFDKKKNRLGYGKGFYDRYLFKLKKLNKKAEAIGVAFSFQRYKKLPISKFDFKLNSIFTEKGFLK